jgi:cell division protein FtsB
MTLTFPHPGCTCHHCEVARATQAFRDRLLQAHAENEAQEREIKDLRQQVRNLGEQVALLNQQMVGMIRERNERKEEG